MKMARDSFPINLSRLICHSIYLHVSLRLSVCLPLVCLFASADFCRLLNVKGVRYIFLVLCYVTHVFFLLSVFLSVCHLRTLEMWYEISTTSLDVLFLIPISLHYAYSYPLLSMSIAVYRCLLVCLSVYSNQDCLSPKFSFESVRYNLC